VRVDRLDRLINLTGELVVGQQMIANHAHSLELALPMLQEQERDLLALETELRTLSMSAGRRSTLDNHINKLLNTSDQLRQLLRKQSEQFSQQVDHQAFLVSDLEQEVMTARLIPISNTFSRLHRVVRELSHTTGKEIDLQVQGETTELDRKMLEAISDPLMHMVRNAVDHGIEPAAERIEQGKPLPGRVGISAEALGNEVRVTVSDDGRGMEAQKIRESAVQKGLISGENAAMLSDQEALELIFLPGFSTATIITDVSGRGVGMDVVRTNIIELGGQIVINAEPGEGTAVTIVLPLTLVTTRVLLVLVGRHTFALPALGCRGIIWVDPEHIHTIEGRATITHEGHTTPLIHMADVMGLESSSIFQNHRRAPAVLVGTEQRTMSFLVDRVLDEREAVVKSLGPLLELQRRYTGAIQLGDGQLVLLLNPMALIQAARGIGTVMLTQRSISPTTRQQFDLLLAEDSFTTRELIRSILSSAGYNVTGATDGADALDKLRTRSYDLVITDVEMPRVDGFELTSRIREELGIRDMPVVIITSLASDEHRRRGLEAGAQGYIVKSQFNQDNLLEIVQQLLGSA
jgi:two-component system chemotaxis sensor kinase CheA